MNNENYFNHYVETLTNTMTDAILRNISLQASVKVGEESLKEYEKTIELLDAEIGKLKQQLESERTERQSSENSKIYQVEVETNKHQLQHIETFRKELLKSREENEKLKSEIEYLKLTPAKRKKYDESVTVKEVFDSNKINNEESTKDGGSF
jgi:cell division protein FtsB